MQTQPRIRKFPVENDSNKDKMVKGMKPWVSITDALSVQHL
jgi:hypothetical protein